MITIKIFNYVITALQGLCLLSVLILEKLTTMKPLVMQHVYVRRFEHLKYLTLTNRVGSVATFLIVVAISLFVSKKSLKEHKSLIIVTTIVCIVLLLPLQFMMSYSYFIGAIFSIGLLEYIKFGLRERF